jgi:hypothetical protein
MAGSNRLAEFGTKIPVRIELYTRSYHASGDMEVSRWHITDVMNDKIRPTLTIENAIREPLPQMIHTGDEGLARATPYLQIAKTAIVLAVPHENTSLASARQQYINALYQERAQAEAIVIAPPFEVRATVHLRRAFQIRTALDEMPNEYIPVTDMEAVYIPDPRLRINAEFAVINRPLAELFSLTDDGPRRVGRGFRQPS